MTPNLSVKITISTTRERLLPLSYIYVIRFLGRLEFTPDTPPSIPDTVSSASFFMPGTFPKIKVPNMNKSANIIIPHIIPSVIPRLRRYFPHRNAPEKPDVTSAADERIPMNFQSSMKKKTNAEKIRALISPHRLPNSEDSAILGKVFVHMLLRYLCIKKPPHRILYILWRGFAF